MPKYIKANPGPGRSVIYTDTAGKDWEYSKGTRPWRNQNPGNLVPGTVSKRNGAIGAAGDFAVFPNYETGHSALIDLLKNVYRNYDIPKLMGAYAPSHENKTKEYIVCIRKNTGIKDNKKLKDFSAAEFEKLWKAMEKMEGWREGTIKASKKRTCDSSKK